MPPRTCSIDDCDRTVYGKGWCSMHWRRWYRNGDPLKVRERRANASSFQPGQAAHNKGVPATPEARARMSAASMGQVAWNKGKSWPAEHVETKMRGQKRSDSTKARIRSARARQVITDEHRNAISAGLAGKPKSAEHVAKLSGAANYRYKGRIGRKLSTKAWREVRAVVLARDEYTCQTCGDTEIGHLLAHHIIEFRDGGPDTPENLVTWCRACHARHHSTKRHRATT